jgi:hypothetical protein
MTEKLRLGIRVGESWDEILESDVHGGLAEFGFYAVESCMSGVDIVF